MAKTKHRPADDLYWRRPWSQSLFAGDLFEAIPFSSQPTVVVEADGDQGEHKHYIGEIGFAYGLLMTPTARFPVPQLQHARRHPGRQTRFDPKPGLLSSLPLPSVLSWFGRG